MQSLGQLAADEVATSLAKGLDRAPRGHEQDVALFGEGSDGDLARLVQAISREPQLVSHLVDLGQGVDHALPRPGQLRLDREQPLNRSDQHVALFAR